MSETTNTVPGNFIRTIIDEELAAGKHDKVATRFPPEPNGYLHIGHAKSIVLNFGIASDYQGTCNLRFDDTNPHKENKEFVEAIKKDVEWLGYKWDALYFASDYFEQLYGFAVELIEQGKAYVCELNAEQMREYRGTLTEPGKESPYRSRSVEENLELFKQMRSGDFEDGSKVLRAKIDMAAPNLNMRDPVLYRIRHGVIHHQTGAEWVLYPMYDFTHPISDAIEGITHSLCTLEFEDHRPLYDWVLDNISIECHPRQIEFSRLNLQYTVMSKRKLTQLVDENLVEGWSDPRMPTIAGLRRRGYTPVALREFAKRIGVTKSDNSIEMELLEACIREDLDRCAPRRMAVLNPLKVTITNYPEGESEELPAANHPKDESMGQRPVKLAREVYIDRDDFIEVRPNKKWKRLVAGEEVRLRNAYVIRCDEVIKDDSGEIVELKCSYDPDTLGANPPDRKIKGVIHWVSASHSEPAEVRLYDRLLDHPAPDADKTVEDWKQHLNANSLVTCENARVEASLVDATAGQQFQFEREGYFCRDSDSGGERLIFNRVVTLRDSWGK
ncbi:glutamine--tRNA ligase/YqeY domain fusion protein [Solemya velum gill symbiont]|uniref:glutamine--tRNA ligase/YqeY domain fusion protein n=1 Tax=Solemya velum gill symbiont TaxID=2340 RepID=UPI00099812F6|nr:glutamine--tRNA ligase/YqeY domain fusion protein [Solemya velum gill symbiont]OOZ45383.1 glutamine--tRNA ligase [Solemya velum gill symbiont]OOZ47067.1 glutamine--tRNA ligase [Solemya velum gill symbiont]OOZ49353.1 glutamine--tRNA ligase [Solemya velum gill symbiont]OOZ52167.1 glutamine--tRNA ligase [Solemya velum gill symbiont]OOZ54968.1 glutamine--tRNA ligase [Solemya velum gill symbiont]